MSLFDALARAKTEEDVKDAYIKALGLKTYFKGLVDIQTEEVWFEAKGAPNLACCRFGGHRDRLNQARPASRSKSMGLR